MKLKWYGHSCFSLSYEGGPVLVTDPFDDSVGYPLCTATCDAVLISHDHYDHNYVQSLSGNPERIADTRSREMKNGVRIYGIDCFHDDAGGSKRGKNRIFVLEGEGLRIAHLGDLGHLLSAEQLKALGKIDILLIPIGGTYTITTPEAAELIDAIRPHTAIAMHFRTDACHSFAARAARRSPPRKSPSPRKALKRSPARSFCNTDPQIFMGVPNAEAPASSQNEETGALLFSILLPDPFGLQAKHLFPGQFSIRSLFGGKQLLQAAVPQDRIYLKGLTGQIQDAQSVHGIPRLAGELFQLRQAIGVLREIEAFPGLGRKSRFPELLELGIKSLGLGGECKAFQAGLPVKFPGARIHLLERIIVTDHLFCQAELRLVGREPRQAMFAGIVVGLADALDRPIARAQNARPTVVDQAVERFQNVGYRAILVIPMQPVNIDKIRPERLKASLNIPFDLAPAKAAAMHVLHGRMRALGPQHDLFPCAAPFQPAADHLFGTALFSGNKIPVYARGINIVPTHFGIRIQTIKRHALGDFSPEIHSPQRQDGGLFSGKFPVSH